MSIPMASEARCYDRKSHQDHGIDHGRKKSISAGQSPTKAQNFADLDRANMDKHVYPMSTILTYDIFIIMGLPDAYYLTLKTHSPNSLWIRHRRKNSESEFKNNHLRASR